MSRFKKIIFIVLIIVFVFIFIVGIVLLRSKPLMDGEIKLKGLVDKVIVTRDAYGVPHIRAQNELDAAKVLGYTMASDRLFQMEIQRRLASGRLGEVFGEAALETDLTMRALKLRETMKNVISTPEVEKWMAAYFDGINYFIQNSPLPVEFYLLQIKPEPFTKLDAYAFSGYMSYSFELAPKQDLLMSNLLSRWPQQLVNELRFDSASKNAENKKNVKTDKSNYRTFAGVERFLQGGFAPLEGSNAWLISSEKSQSGFPILANDPHIGFSLPGVWYEAHIQTPLYEMYGHHLPLIPFAVLGHNREYAWGFTMSGHDDMDFYKEKIEKGKYFFKNQWLPMKKREESIIIRGRSEPLKTVFYETHHGPLMDSIFDEKGISLRWSFHSPNNDPMKVLFGLSHASNMEEFKKTISYGISPGLNIMYADKKNIMWWMHGEFTIRPEHVLSDFILDGSSGKDEPLGTLSFEQKPHRINPKEGFIASANFQPEGFKESGYWQPDDRLKTIQLALDKKEKWKVEDVQRLQIFNSNIENQKILKILLSTVESDPDFLGKNSIPIEELKRWNFQNEETSVAASLFNAWNIENMKILTQEFTDDQQEVYSQLPSMWMFYKRVLFQRHHPWLEHMKQNQSQIFKQGFANMIKRLELKFGKNIRDWQWGKLHTVKYNHPLGKIAVLDPFFSLGDFSASGNYNDVNNMKSGGFKKQFDVVVGPSTRRIIDMANPQTAYGILPVGNSGHPLSPYYKDQLQLFLRGQYREASLNEKSQHQLIFAPQN